MKMKIAASIAGGVLLSGMAAPPAQAEGSRTSYISWWIQGHESNRWWDGSSDTWDTAVELSNCETEGHFSWVSLSLWRDISSAPDRSYGGYTNDCGRTAWGDVAAGTYYFKVDSFREGEHFSAKPVNIYW
ncbi:hypothetical protein ABT237_22305 [Streptomyces sp. NPDC001581]|uniref:hypothetical protein n=1 Tax=Streptomyces sp. NPDC001581 TaxID=3154386 RepID=UPI0033242B52